MNVELPNGEIAEFPDDMPQEQIQSVLQKQFGNPQRQTEERPPEPQGWSGVWSDVFDSIAKTPEAIGNFAKQLPKQAEESLGQYALNKPRFLANLAAGLLQGAKGIPNLVNKSSNYFTEKGLNDETLKSIGMTRDQMLKLTQPVIPQDTGLQKKVLGTPQRGDELIQGFASYLPFMSIGAGATGIRGLVNRGVGAGAYATGQEQNPIIAGLTSGTAELGGKGISKGFQTITDPNAFLASYLRGRLSPEQLQQNLRAAQGTNTPLGNVIGNRSLNVAHDISSNVPFSGSEDIMHELKNQIENKANQVVQNLAPSNIKGDLNDLTQSLLESSYEKQENIKNETYNERNQIAKKEGFELKESPRLEKSFIGSKINIKNIQGLTPKQESTLQYLSDIGTTKANEKAIGPYGPSTKPPTLSDAQDLSNFLIREGKSYKGSLDRNDKRIGKSYENMGNSLKKDINDNITKYGSKELKEAHEKADKNYQENYAPFLDKEVYKTLTKEDAQTIIRDIIQPGKSADRYHDIEKINNLLPEDQKHLLGYAYLKGAEDKYGNLDPKQIAALIRNLGNRQFKALFPDEAVRQSLLDYGNLRGMNEKALNRMYIAETGAKSVPLLVLGHLLASSPFKAVGTIAAAKAFNKWSTSPQIRENLVNKMIESAKNQKSTPLGNLSGNMTPLLNALIQSQLQPQSSKEQ